MQRIPEPELMDDLEQACAYAEADFSEPNERFVNLFRERFGDPSDLRVALDLGCGPADIVIRFVKAYPGCRVDAVDGAPAMVRLAEAAIHASGLTERVRLIEGRLPEVRLPRPTYDAVLSNSLLHHLAEPELFWQSLKHWGRDGTMVLVMDLLRPESMNRVDELVERYAADAPPILRRDFRNSLCAAYRTDEIRTQLDRAGLDTLRIDIVSDRHVAVSGRL